MLHFFEQREGREFALQRKSKLPLLLLAGLLLAACPTGGPEESPPAAAAGEDAGSSGGKTGGTGGSGSTGGSGGSSGGTGGNTGGGNTGTGNENTPPPPGPPQLKNGRAEVFYDEDEDKNFGVSVVFTFDVNVSGTTQDDWTLTAEDNKLTATPNATLTLGDDPVTITVSAANSLDKTKTTQAAATVVAVTGIFTRQDHTGSSYKVAGFAGSAARLRSTDPPSDISPWRYVQDPGLQDIFNAVYAPYGPGSDEPYPETLRTLLLDMFTVTIGADNSQDSIELKGALSSFSGPDSLDIAVGPSGGLEGSSLPPFTVPFQALGTSGGDYGHITLRVNGDATLLIKDGGGSAGHFTGGKVEVAPQGKLRGGGSAGRSLGEGVVFLNHNGSFRALDAAGEDWLIGPEKPGAAIVFNGGDQVGDTVETRPGKMAVFAHLTVKKTLALDYSVWIFNEASITIDAQNAPSAPNGLKGLFSAAADGAAHKLYGRTSASGGQNPATPTAKIILRPGSTIDRAFLVPGSLTESRPITAGAESITIENRGSGPSEKYGESEGYLNWKLP